jgi:MFS family permease
MPGWKRTYWAVWTANVLTGAGMMSFLPFFPGHLERLGVLDREAVATWTGAIFGATPLTAALMAPVWGALGDRLGRRLMVVRAMLSISVFVGAMAFATTPLHLFLLRIAQGFFSGFVAPSQTLVSVVAPASEQGRVAGALQTALALGAVVGPFVGGVVKESAGLPALFLGVAGVSAASAVLVYFGTHEVVGIPRVERAASVPALVRESARDLAHVFDNPRVRRGLVVLFCIQLGVGATNPLLEIFVEELDGGGRVPWTGLLFSVMALSNLVALPAWGRYGDRVGHGRALVIGALACAAAFSLHALATGLALLFVARLALGVASAGAGPAAFGLAAVEISADRRGGAFGAVFAARALAVAASAFTGGWLAGLVGMRGLFALGAACVLACALSAVVSDRVGAAR